MICPILIRVECYAGSRAEETPRVLHWEGRCLEVEEILDRWYQGGSDPIEPCADYFKVRTRDGRKYLIKFDRSAHAWFLVSELE